MPNNRLIDIQEIQNYLEQVYKDPMNASKKFQKDISQPTNRLTDIQEIQIYFELVCQHPGNVSRIFQEDISSRTGYTPILK